MNVKELNWRDRSEPNEYISVFGNFPITKGDDVFSIANYWVSNFYDVKIYTHTLI